MNTVFDQFVVFTLNPPSLFEPADTCAPDWSPHPFSPLRSLHLTEIPCPGKPVGMVAPVPAAAGVETLCSSKCQQYWCSSVGPRRKPWLCVLCVPCLAVRVPHYRQDNSVIQPGHRLPTLPQAYAQLLLLSEFSIFYSFCVFCIWNTNFILKINYKYTSSQERWWCYSLGGVRAIKQVCGRYELGSAILKLLLLDCTCRTGISCTFMKTTKKPNSSVLQKVQTRLHVSSIDPVWIYCKLFDKGTFWSLE